MIVPLPFGDADVRGGYRALPSKIARLPFEVRDAVSREKDNARKRSARQRAACRGPEAPQRPYLAG